MLMSSHSLLLRTSVLAGSRTVKAWARNVAALLSISDESSCGRV
jgi:hypothetical protein